MISHTNSILLPHIRVVQIMYRGLSPLEAGIMTIPLVLYQGSQVVLGQITAVSMKNYIAREKLKELKLREEKEKVVEISESEGKEELEGESEEGTVIEDVRVRSKLEV